MRQIKDFKTMKERKSVHNCRVGSLLWKLEEEAQWTWVYIGEFQFPLPVLCASTEFPGARAQARDRKDTEAHEHCI